MTGEELLNSLRHLECEITALDQTRVYLNWRREGIIDRTMASPNVSGVNVKSSPGDRTATLGCELADDPTPQEVVAKINALQKEVNRKIDAMVDGKRAAFEVIGKLTDGRHRALLIMRYVNSRDWPEVADAMGYSENWVQTDLRADAVAAFEEAWKTTM